MGQESLTTSHAYCENCEEIAPVFFEGAVADSTDGVFIGGDVVCKVCAYIVATLYNERPEAK